MNICSTTEGGGSGGGPSGITDGPPTASRTAPGPNRGHFSLASVSLKPLKTVPRERQADLESETIRPSWEQQCMLGGEPALLINAINDPSALCLHNPGPRAPPHQLIQHVTFSPAGVKKLRLDLEPRSGPGPAAGFSSPNSSFAGTQPEILTSAHLPPTFLLFVSARKESKRFFPSDWQQRRQRGAVPGKVQTFYAKKKKENTDVLTRTKDK